MTLLSLSLRGLGRNRARTVLTILAVAVAVLAFVLLRTITAAYFVFVNSAAEDRLATRHKVGPTVPIPKRFVDAVREVEGVRAATGGLFVGGTTSKKPGTFVATIAVDARSITDVFDEIEIDPETLARWQSNRQGAIVGDTLAKKLAISQGDRITLEGKQVPGSWEVVVEGIYTTSRVAFERSSLLFHWDYLNETVPDGRREQYDWIFARVEDVSAGAAIGKAIDARLENEGVPTVTMSQRARYLSFLGGTSAVLRAIDIGVVGILLIVLLILANTIAMGVRERISEYAVLRALGFPHRQIGSAIVAEGVVIGLLAGVLGAAISYPLVELALGRWLEENVSEIVPHFRIRPITYVAALGAAVGLGAAASLLPALRAARLSVVDALRRT